METSMDKVTLSVEPEWIPIFSWRPRQEVAHRLWSRGSDLLDAVRCREGRANLGSEQEVSDMGKPYSELWERTATKGEVYSPGTHLERRETWSLAHAYAGPDYVNNGSFLRIGQKLNASGYQAFGGATTWPYVALEVALPEDRQDLVEPLRELLAETIARFLCDAGLRRTE